MFPHVSRDSIILNNMTTENKDNPKACRKRQADATKACSVTMSLALQQAIIRKADAEDRSFSATVRRAVERYLAGAV
jgi:hypothetical protein